MKTYRHTAPIACSLERGKMAQQHVRWQALHTRAGIDVVPSGRGIRLSFRRGPGVEEELRKLVALERSCCGFADWSISSDSEQVVLEVTGDSDEAIAAVQAMFGSLAAAASKPSPVADPADGEATPARDRSVSGALSLACLACLVPGLLAAGAAGVVAGAVGGRQSLFVGAAAGLAVLAVGTNRLRRSTKAAAAHGGSSCGC